MRDIIFPITYKHDPKGLKHAESAIEKFGKSVATIGVAAFAAASAAAVAFGVASVKAAAEAEAVTRGLENAARNAGIFGDSASAIGKATNALDKHSRALSEMSGIDDEIINQIKTGWLAVPDLAALGTEGINRLAEVVADVAAGTGKDAQAIGLAFQRIAGDTDSAFTKLTRAGIVFTDEQKATFDAILATSGEMAAQGYLVDELARKYEGAAEAGANPFERLRVIFGNLQEDIGAKLLPAIEPIIPMFQNLANSLVTSPEFNAFLNEMSDTFVEMLPSVQSVLENFITFSTSTLPELNPLMEILGDALDIVAIGFGRINEVSPQTESNLSNLAFIVGTIADAFKAVDEWVGQSQGAFADWGPVVRGIIDSVVFALNPLKFLLDTIVALIKFVQMNYQPWMQNPSAQTPRQGGRPLIPGTAKGGVTALQGLQWVGEKGPELLSMPKGATVTPIPQHMRAEAMMGANTGGGNGGNTYAITVNAGMGTNGTQVGQEIIKAISQFERGNGRVFARA